MIPEPTVGGKRFLPEDVADDGAELPGPRGRGEIRLDDPVAASDFDVEKLNPSESQLYKALN